MFPPRHQSALRLLDALRILNTSIRGTYYSGIDSTEHQLPNTILIRSLLGQEVESFDTKPVKIIASTRQRKTFVTRGLQQSRGNATTKRLPKYSNGVLGSLDTYRELQVITFHGNHSPFLSVFEIWEAKAGRVVLHNITDRILDGLSHTSHRSRSTVNNTDRVDHIDHIDHLQ